MPGSTQDRSPSWNSQVIRPLPKTSRCAGPWGMGAIERLPSYLAGDVTEGVAETGADERESGDRGDRNQGGDQSIFDGCNPGLVTNQIGKNGAQVDSPQIETSSREQVAPD